MGDDQWGPVRGIHGEAISSDDAEGYSHTLNVAQARGPLDTPAACALVGFLVYAALRVLGWW